MDEGAIWIARGAALAVALCACESSAPASSRRAPAPVASDWIGVRAAPVVAALVLAPDDGTSAASPQRGQPAGSKSAWVLHVGDSFVDASFAQNLASRFRAAGVRQVALAKTATYTTTWAYDPELDRLLARQPSLVLVTLGANEVDNAVPQLHAGAIHGLAHKIGATAPCVWVAPPMWKADAAGWLQVIHDHCAPCLFFDSDAVLGGLGVDERRRDRVHPNERGGARWAEAFWEWLTAHRDPTRDAWTLTPFERR
jgi:lysophospholipase L1-like esterase